MESPPRDPVKKNLLRELLREIWAWLLTWAGGTTGAVLDKVWWLVDPPLPRAWWPKLREMGGGPSPSSCVVAGAEGDGRGGADGDG
jgi:hypothetical protein